MATFDEFYAQAKQRVPSASLEDIRTAYSRMTGNEPILQQGPSRKEFEAQARSRPSLATVSKDDIDSAYDQIYGGGGVGSEAWRSAKRGLVGLGTTALGAGEWAKDALGQLPPWLGNAGLAGAAMNAPGLPDISQARKDLQEYQHSIPRSAASQGDVTEDLGQSLGNPLWWAAGAPEMIASQIPVVAGAAFGGPLGAGLVGGLMEGQSTYATAKDAGLENPGLRGLGMAGATGVLNAIPFLGNAGRGILPMAGRMLKEGVTEGAEEIPGAFLEAPVDQWNSATLQEGLRRGANIAPLAALGGAMNGLGNRDTTVADNLRDQLDLMKGQDQQLAAPMPEFQPPQPVAQQAPAPVDFGSLAGEANNIASTLDQRRNATSIADLAATVPPAPTVDPVVRQKAEQKFQAEQTAALETKKTGVSQIIAPIVSKWKGAPGINVVGTYEELPDEIKANQEPGLDAVYDGRGNVWMVADQLKDRVQVEKRLLHESLGHYGIEQIVGGKPELEKFSADVLRFASKDKQFADILKDVQVAYEGKGDFIHGLEVVAKYSENHPNNKHPLMERIYASLRQFARKMGVKVQLNRADLNRMLRISMRNLEQGAGGQMVTNGVAKASKQAPVVNSQGKPVHPNVEGQQNFTKWFGDSKVADEQGLPLVVYHGTTSEFDGFDGASQKTYKVGALGHFFTGSQSVSNEYASGEGGRVVPVYLSIKNPKKEGLKRLGRCTSKASVAAYRKQAEADGFDGVIFYGPGGSTEYVAFNPEQIKSAIGNSGQFDPSNPSIKASRPLQQELPGVPVKPERDSVMEGIVQQLGKITGLSEEARKLMLEVATMDKAKLVARGRGVRSWDVTSEAAKQLASDLGFEGVEALYNSPLGAALNAEQLTFAASDLQQASEAASFYNQQLLANSSPENMILYKAALEAMQLRLAAFRGFSTEAGRALNILNRTAPLVQNVNQLLEAYVPNEKGLMAFATKHAKALAEDVTPASQAVGEEIARNNNAAKVMAGELQQTSATRNRNSAEMAALQTALADAEAQKAAAPKEVADAINKEAARIKSRLKALAESERKLAEKEAGLEQGLVQIEAKKTELAARRKKLKKGGAAGKLIKEWKPTVGDMLLELFYSNILSGPATHMANIGGNTIFGILEESVKQITLRTTGQSGAAQARLNALWFGATTGLANAKKAFATEQPQLDQQTKLDHQSHAAIPGRTGRVVRLPGRALLAEDEFFKGIAYTMELAEIAYRETGGNMAAAQAIMDNPNIDQVQSAIMEARRLTFTSKLGSRMGAVQRLLNETKAAKVVVPFVQTPTNLLYRAMDWSPLGLLGVLGDTQIGRDLKGKGGNTPAESRAKQRMAFTRQTLGGVLLIMGWEMAAQGLLAGNGPPDPDRNEVWRRANGLSGTKMIRLSADGPWMSFGRFDPLAIPLSIIADMHYASQQTDKLEMKDMGLLLMASFATNMADKTWLNGVSTFVEALAQPERQMEYFVGNIATGFVPTNAIAQTMSANDPYLRDARSIMDRVWAKIPGLRNEIPLKVNLAGEEAQNHAATIFGLAAPWQTSDGKPDPIAQKMIEVGFDKGVPQRELMGAKLEGDDYHDWKMLVQQKRYRILQGMVSNPNFNRLTKERQKELMEKAWDSVTGTSREAKNMKYRFIFQRDNLRKEVARIRQGAG